MLTANSAAANGVEWTTVSATPGGANTHIQFNDGGVFGGDADFTWNKTTNVLTVNGEALIMYGVTVSNNYLILQKNTNSGLFISTPTAAIDEKEWSWISAGSSLSLRAYNDAREVSSVAMSFTRSGNTVAGIELGTNNQTRMSINSAGNVTISTPTSGEALIANGDIRANGTTAAGRIWLGSGNFGLFYDGSLNYQLPVANLTVGSNVTAGGAFSGSGSWTNSGPEIKVGTGQNEEKRIRFHNANRDVYFALNSTNLNLWDVTGAFNRWTTDTAGNFTAAGNVTAYSDKRLKTNIKPIENALEKVTSLTGVSFTRTDTKQQGIGLIAQDVQQVFPEVVVEAGDEQKTLSVAYGNLIGPLIEAIKVLSKQVDDLKQEIKHLKTPQ